MEVYVFHNTCRSKYIVKQHTCWPLFFLSFVFLLISSIEDNCVLLLGKQEVTNYFKDTVMLQ